MLIAVQDYAIGETESLVLKAYRGAGLSWGLAQEAANTAAWMAMRGLPVLDEFAKLVQQIDKVDSALLSPDVSVLTEWCNPSGRLCPVIAGCAFAESRLAQHHLKSGVQIKGVLQPLIMIGFIARVANQLRRNLIVEDVDAEFSYELLAEGGVYSPGMDCQSGGPSKSDLVIHESMSKPQIVDPPSVYQRANASVDTLEILERFAYRTYVPATDESRNAGAGAGLLDND